MIYRIGISLIVLVIFIAAGCKKNDHDKKQSLTGTWRLIIQTGGLTGNQRYTPPASEIHLLHININGTYSFTVDDTVKGHGNYQLVQVQSIYTATTVDAIAFGSSNTQLYTFKKDTLLLTDNHAEPFSSSYIRIR